MYRLKELSEFKDSIYIWEIHPSFAYIDFLSVKLEIDFNTGVLAKGCGNPDKAFTNCKAASSNKVSIFTARDMFQIVTLTLVGLFPMDFSRILFEPIIYNSFAAET